MASDESFLYRPHGSLPLLYKQLLQSQILSLHGIRWNPTDNGNSLASAKNNVTLPMVTVVRDNLTYSFC